MRKLGSGSLLIPFKTTNNKTMTVLLAYDTDTPIDVHVPVIIQQNVITTPFGSILRIHVKIYDDPLNPLWLESFINPEDERQVRDWIRLDEQDVLPIFFIDKSGKLIRKMGVPIKKLKGEFKRSYEIAKSYNERIKEYDFERAKAYFYGEFIE